MESLAGFALACGLVSQASITKDETPVRLVGFKGRDACKTQRYDREFYNGADGQIASDF